MACKATRYRLRESDSIWIGWNAVTERTAKLLSRYRKHEIRLTAVPEDLHEAERQRNKKAVSEATLIG